MMIAFTEKAPIDGFAPDSMNEADYRMVDCRKFYEKNQDGINAFRLALYVVEDSKRGFETPASVTAYMRTERK